MVRIKVGGTGRHPSLITTWRWLCLIPLLWCAIAAPPIAAQSDDDEVVAQRAQTVDSDDAAALAERFSPIVMVRQQESACDTTGEPYLPAPVDVVLGNPHVTLRQNDGGARSADPVLVVAPDAADLATADADTYLDFPGNSRNPGCSYERWFRASMAGYEPTVYARVAETNAGQVVVQYHLFYVFNDFNNTHESDWEMVQLLFDTPTVAGALVSEPSQIALAQHGGGRWRIGTRRSCRKRETTPLSTPRRDPTPPSMAPRRTSAGGRTGRDSDVTTPKTPSCGWM